MKIRIIGGSGSGKTHLGKILSLKYVIPHFDLDDIFWDNQASSYGIKTSPVLRDKKLNEILKSDHWIIEGVYYGEWTKRSFLEADQVIILTPNVYLQHWRVIIRWFKRKLGLLPAKKKETLKGLYELINWNHRYNRNELQKIKRLYSSCFKQG
ncbi:MAG: DNA topology modulation protein FlaR [Oligoflexia bacterium]|nr:DNA topology modulation protein FlaR [Oligoflexia bacterium]MBF0367499.1 DNA topology modulation protein FlaR [Oligoflexia bacterium]